MRRILHDAISRNTYLRIKNVIVCSAALNGRRMGSALHLPARSRSQSDPEEVDPLLREQPLLTEMYGASLQGIIGSGQRAGERITTVGFEEEYESTKGGRRCANLSGFSLHANVCIPAKARHQLEKLCRYVARPPIAMERLSKLPDGRVLYQLRHRWRNGAMAQRI